MPNDSMIRRVAEAMVEADSGPVGSKLFAIHWQEFGSGYMDSARVALEAMREPTDKMRYAGYDAAADLAASWDRPSWDSDIDAGYQAMINAALEEEK